MSSVEFKDNSAAVLAAMDRGKKKTLTALGLGGVEVTTDYMQSRYGAPIRQTGDLMRDVNFRVNTGEDTVSIGNSLEYAPLVHNGTRRMSARPYLRDAVSENTDIWKEISADHIGAEVK